MPKPFSTNRKYLFFFKKFFLQLSLRECGICCTTPWHKNKLHIINSYWRSNLHLYDIFWYLHNILQKLKDCVCYTFASLFFKTKKEHLWNREKCILFHLKNSFRFWDNQSLEFRIFNFHNIITCQSRKQEIHFTK